MAWTGDYMSILTEIMNERPMDDVIESIGFRNAIYNRVTKTSRQEDFYGRYAKLLIHTGFGMNAAPRVERGDVPYPGQDAFMEIHLNESEYMGSIGWTQEELEGAVRAKGAALIDLVNLKMKNAPLDMRFKLNYAFQMDGTGRLARVSANTETAATTINALTVDNDVTYKDFGCKTTKFIRNGMKVDVWHLVSNPGATFPVEATFACRAWNATVSAVNHSAGTFTITYDGTTLLGTSSHVIADGDFVFLHNSMIVGTSSADASTAVAVPAIGTTYDWIAWTNTPGLRAICDDNGCSGNEFTAGGSAELHNGSWYGRAFQAVSHAGGAAVAANASRGSYATLLGRVAKADTWGAGTGGTSMACDLEVINGEIRRIDEESETGGEVTAMYMNGATRDWMAGLAYAQQNAFVQVTDGKIIPGIPNITGFRSATGRIIPVIPASLMPDSEILMGDERDLILFQSIPIDWYMGMGSKSFAAPGSRNLTFEQWLRTKCLLAAKRCDNWTRIEDIDLTA